LDSDIFTELKPYFGPKNIMTKSVIVTTIILSLSAFVSFNFISLAYANPCTANPCPVAISQPVNVGDNTIFFRDFNTPDNSTVTASLDKSSYLLSQTAILTINDFNENLDTSATDTITAQVSSVGNVNLNETGTNTGIFTGHFVVSSQSISVSYTPQPNTGRLKLTLDGVTTGGTVEFTDFIVDSSYAQNLCFIPVVHPVHVNLAGVTLGPGGMGVSMSYADGLLGDQNFFTPDLLQMYFQPDGAGWQLITDTDGNQPGFNDFVSETVTNANPITQSGLVTLGFLTGCGGGGSSGLVSAGLVLNFLASAGRAEANVVAPPSFGGGSNHYSDGLTLTQGGTKTTFDTSLYNQEIPKQVMASGQNINMTFKTFEGYDPTGVVHMGLYVIPSGQDMTTDNSIGSIVWEKGVPVEISDPNHILSKANASVSSDGKFQYTSFTFVPTKSYYKMSFLVRAWNDQLYSTDIRVYDKVDPQVPTYDKPSWLHIYGNLHDADFAVEGAGFLKPAIFSHISTSEQVWGQTDRGTVLWFFDEKDEAVAVEAFDSNRNVVWVQSELLDKKIPSPTQGPDASYAGNHLNRWDKIALEKAQKEQEERVDTTLQMLGYQVYWEHNIN